MGALTSLATKWIPEDDLMLKNAVEAGASLESLAKGAVQFSRRFTIHELEDRWRSLLYDLDVSIEASARMVEIEMELAAPNIPKSNRPVIHNSKGKESLPAKRKGDSVRSHYYAMRKRIRSEPSAANLSFLASPALLSDNGFDSRPMDRLKTHIKHPAGSFALEIPQPENCGHLDTAYGNGQHAFSALRSVNHAARNVSHQSYHGQHVGTVETETPGKTLHKDGLFEFTGNISPGQYDGTEYNNGNQPFEHNFQQRDFPNILGENLISVDSSSDANEINPSNALGKNSVDVNDDIGAKPLYQFDSSNRNHEGDCSEFVGNDTLCSRVHEFSQSNALGTCSLYHDDNIGAKPLSGFDSSKDNHKGFCSDFVRNNNLNSHVPECSVSFHQPEYSSPSSCMPIWRAMEDMSTPTMPMDGHYGDKTHELHKMDDHKNNDGPSCDVVSESNLEDGVSGAGLENDFIDFSDSYMDFADGEDLLFMDVDEKDNTNRSSLDLPSGLLSSPCATHHGIVASNDHGSTNMLETSLSIPNAACTEESKVLCDQMLPGLHDYHKTSVSGDKVPSTNLQPSSTTEPLQEFIICKLNTEDLDIPDNDDAIFPAQVSPSFPSDYKQCERTVLDSTAHVLTTDVRCSLGDVSHVKEQKTFVDATVASSRCSPSLAKVGVLNSCDDQAMRTKSFKGGSLDGGSRYAGNGADKLKPFNSESVAVESASVDALKEESTDQTFQNQDNPEASFATFLESHLQDGCDAKHEPLNATNRPEEANMQCVLQASLLPHPDVVPAEVGLQETVAIMSTSDQEGQFSDIEDDVPYFSDIEALILDMDLGLYDEESGPFSKEGSVSRNQHAATKSIIRWEQSFHSHINRSISSHGAFAVFYGRHLKYFIKDTEVSIGRETKDFKVNIDLGREGRANKISRRQAIIKMDEEGAFSLKNIGRNSIFVNGKEVPAKKQTNLLSHSLIKIQDMQFAFEVNEKAVWCHIKKDRRSSHEQGAFRFDLKPDQNP